jgi:hypothetical protein
MRSWAGSVLAALTVALSAGHANGAPPKSPDRYTVRFTTRVISGSDHSLPIVFDARYDGPGSAAHFEITLTNKRVGLIAVDGSNPASFLAALEKALEAKRLPLHPRRVNRLDVDAVILDYKKSTGWIYAKLFFGNDQGEVYLNLNLKTGLGEFSEKDIDCGNYVLAQLARVV